MRPAACHLRWSLPGGTRRRPGGPASGGWSLERARRGGCRMHRAQRLRGWSLEGGDAAVATWGMRQAGSWRWGAAHRATGAGAGASPRRSRLSWWLDRESGDGESWDGW
ncbi:Os12g0131601 [Oryza sativa Japonica Group]|uniref:Os12g0131601 protein n=1 Tax=Oryza sativa subsp. japonica TaxID=39947 RepID=A0A0P0Y6L7_ORYSJ|nr:Os12g0131601 [Oryza sativa Japonica Group]